MDKGPELTSAKMAEWAEEHGYRAGVYSAQKTDAKLLHRTFKQDYREEVLDFYLFKRLSEAREATDRCYQNIMKNDHMIHWEI